MCVWCVCLYFQVCVFVCVHSHMCLSALLSVQALGMQKLMLVTYEEFDQVRIITGSGEGNDDPCTVWCVCDV